MKATDLTCREPIQLSNDGISTPPEMIPVTYLNVNGREEHESLLKDAQKCSELGLDIFYETMVYIRRWGGWLNEKQ